MKPRVASLAACALLGSCLDPNGDFDGPAGTTDGEASSTLDGASSSETSASCEPDGFEPNDEAEAPIVLGSHEAVLEDVDAIDRYNIFFTDVGSAELSMVADADVRVCAFIDCEGTFDPPAYDCATGLSGSSEDGQVGCCGGPAVGMTFTCTPGLGAKLHLRVDEAPAACTFYGVQLADALP